MRRCWRTIVVVLLLVALPSVAIAETGELERRLREAQQERQRAQQQLEETRGLEGDARERLAQADAELNREEAELAELRAELDLARATLAQAEERARVAREMLAEVNEELGDAEAELHEQKSRLDNRIRATFKYGSVSFAEAFTGVRDIADFLNHTQYVAHVLGNDRDIVQSVQASLGHVEQQRELARQLREDAERDEAEAARTAARIEEATIEQRSLAESVRERRRERAAALEELRDDRSALEGHLAGLEAESSRIQQQLAEIARRQAQEAQRRAIERWEKAVKEWEACQKDNEKKQAEYHKALEAWQAENSDGDGDGDSDGEPSEPSGPSGPSEPSGPPEPSEPPEEPTLKDCGDKPPSSPPSASDSVSPGGWVRPVPGRVSSSFGPPRGRFPYGVDRANSMGTTVRAAQAGEVVWRVSGCNPTSSWGCGGGFGNYVVIDHGGGFATVYAHLSSSNVSTGSRVSAGQSIGSVGNSGNSYGPHLHFEFYDGGVRRNPCSYIGC